jgi:hypothetical protein
VFCVIPYCTNLHRFHILREFTSTTFRRYKVSFPDLTRLAVTLTTHLRHMLRLRVSGVTHQFTLHVFVLWTEKGLLLFHEFRHTHTLTHTHTHIHVTFH